MSWDDIGEAFNRLHSSRFPHWDNYLGFYSSWLGGYFREPAGMLLPMDDHGFHRGDGVFEAARLVDRAYFDLREHLLRLKNSATAIGMELPKSLDEIEKICVELARRTVADNAILRLYVTRGPGGFSPNPREVVGHQIYAALTSWTPAKAELYEKGCSAMISTVVAKEAFWAKIKSCNYLQNVLMKKEALEKGFDFAISIDLDGRVCEGSTENFMIVTQRGEVVIPKFDYTLRGTTVRVVMRLAEQMGLTVRQDDLALDDLLSAREAAFVGTTLGVMPVGRLGDRRYSIGEICKSLNLKLQDEMRQNSDLRTGL